mgnify:CR=1 FL=1
MNNINKCPDDETWLKREKREHSETRCSLPVCLLPLLTESTQNRQTVLGRLWRKVPRMGS